MVLGEQRQRLVAIGVGAMLAVTVSCAGVDGAAGDAGAVVQASTTELPVAPGDNVSGPYPVTKVVDGDTIWVQRDGRIAKLRLIGIDTPEVHDPRRPIQCFGREASAAAESMLAGAQVLLESDPSQDSFDRYGRGLVYVWVDGQLANLVMIQGGYAHEYTYDAPYRYQALFKAAQQEAERSGVGLWASDTCAGDTSQPASG